MKRLVAVSLILSLVISLAAPTRAVFATEAEVLSEEAVVLSDDVSVTEEAQGSEVEVETVETSGVSVAPILSLTVQSETHTPPANAGSVDTKAAPVADSSQAEKVVQIAPPNPTIANDDDKATTSDVIITSVKVGTSGNLESIELTNTANKAVRVEGWSIVTAQYFDGGEECEIALSGYILAKRSVTFMTEQAQENSFTEGAYTIERCGVSSRPSAVASDMPVRITVENMGVVHERMKPVSNDALYVRQATTETRRTGNFANDFRVLKDKEEYLFKTSTLYEPPDSPPLKITELYTMPEACTPEQELRPECSDYVKLYNDSLETINLAKYRLRVGQVSQASRSDNTYQLYGTVAGKSFVLLRHSSDGGKIALSNESSTAWLQDEFGVMDYPSGVTPYAGADKVANKGRSWALNEQTGQWQWATPAPYSVGNDFTERVIVAKETKTSSKQLVPCKDGQYRSEETNRCRNIVQAGSNLKPCKEGQYRSEETNRCRSIASAAASVLKPCADDQFRNPETNRCKKIASADELADCGEGRERNPTTNRCRNVLASTVPTAGFSPEKVQQVAGATWGWWVFGGVSVLALGYAGWQWRWELKQLAVRSRSFFTRSGK